VIDLVTPAKPHRLTATQQRPPTYREIMEQTGVLMLPSAGLV